MSIHEIFGRPPVSGNREEVRNCAALDLAGQSEVDAGIVEVLSAVPFIEHLFFESDSTTWNVVAVVDDDSDHVSAAVHTTSVSLVERFPNVNFYFHVIARDGRPIREIAGNLQPKWSRGTESPLTMGWWAAAYACMDWIAPIAFESAQVMAQL